MNSGAGSHLLAYMTAILYYKLLLWILTKRLWVGFIMMKLVEKL